MSSNKLDYKIEKYIHKLKNAGTLDEAETYQRKLRQYHRINQFGTSPSNLKGGAALSQKTSQLETVQDLISQLSEMSGMSFTPSGSMRPSSSLKSGGGINIDQIEGKVDEIRSLLGEMKEVNKNSEAINKTESDLGLNNLAIDLGNLSDGSDLDPNDLNFDINQLVKNL